jgi:unconventional prefoldin RPB5 interactor 1
MIHDEVADEYQRMRKRFIQREGGFLKEDESPVQPLEEAHGGPEKISRFKAARLSRQ